MEEIREAPEAVRGLERISAHFHIERVRQLLADIERSVADLQEYGAKMLK